MPEAPKTSGRVTSSLWRPLREPTFRHLLLADVVSDIGTFMQGVGAAWLMVSLGAGPAYVALTQTASSLPFFLLALPAGSAGNFRPPQTDSCHRDLDDRRGGAPGDLYHQRRACHPGSCCY